MKKIKSNKSFVRMRNKLNQDIFYSFSEWESKFIDEVEFIYVVKNIGVQETPKLMRKENLERVKDEKVRS
jgi:hypothetical protein